ncbi:hypothetical protein ACE1TI_10905 [Alteribacillus sp. JSM 102045]|uniref:hypothetical protein n=1 Tax=Alteribacillus sp. JSM 102045 TaxID=1562101 RepID=UPI0035C0DDAE
MNRKTIIIGSFLFAAVVILSFYLLTSVLQSFVSNYEKKAETEQEVKSSEDLVESVVRKDDFPEDDIVHGENKEFNEYVNDAKNHMYHYYYNEFDEDVVKIEDLQHAIDDYLPQAEKAMEKTEHPHLKEDLAEIIVLLTELDKNLENEEIRNSRISTLQKIYWDLDYYVAEYKNSRPSNDSHYADALNPTNIKVTPGEDLREKGDELLSLTTDSYDGYTRVKGLSEPEIEKIVEDMFE